MHIRSVVTMAFSPTNETYCWNTAFLYPLRRSGVLYFNFRGTLASVFSLCVAFIKLALWSLPLNYVHGPEFSIASNNRIDNRYAQKNFANSISPGRFVFISQISFSLCLDVTVQSNAFGNFCNNKTPITKQDLRFEQHQTENSVIFSP